MCHWDECGWLQCGTNNGKAVGSLHIWAIRLRAGLDGCLWAPFNSEYLVIIPSCWQILEESMLTTKPWRTKHHLMSLWDYQRHTFHSARKYQCTWQNLESPLKLHHSSCSLSNLHPWLTDDSWCPAKTHQQNSSKSKAVYSRMAKVCLLALSSTCSYLTLLLKGQISFQRLVVHQVHCNYLYYRATLPLCLWFAQHLPSSNSTSWEHVHNSISPAALWSCTPIKQHVQRQRPPPVVLLSGKGRSSWTRPTKPISL